ncbi:transposase [Mesorhizobium sp. M1348]|uniref:transposase n=1 Tax=unclassified Mesorhizobium TaxID=325217 RepID=UPI00333506CC
MTPDAVDGRSNRRRFSDNQKRAIVQETEKPGVAVAQVCRRHGVATSMVFRWRVEFGLTARKAPQLTTVVLADGAAKELPRSGPCAIWCSRPTAWWRLSWLMDGACLHRPAVLRLR